MSKETREMWKIAAQYSAVGIEITAAVAIGTIGGDWLDKKFGTSYFFWFGVIVGFGAATQAVIRVIKRVKQDQKNDDELGKRPLS